jgi:hypothetical protein
VPSARDLSLARLIRRGRALDAVTRRHWLAVLPHLATEDRERLRSILLDAEATEHTDIVDVMSSAVRRAGEPPAQDVDASGAVRAPSAASEGSATAHADD